MPGLHLLNGDNCETCGKRRNMREHYPNFVPYPGGLREPNHHWHAFKPHLKHKMQLDFVSENTMSLPGTMYHFKCEVCGYIHPCMKNDFHRVNMGPMMNFDDIFTRYGRAFETMSDAFNDVFSKLKKPGG